MAITFNHGGEAEFWDACVEKILHGVTYAHAQGLFINKMNSLAEKQQLEIDGSEWDDFVNKEEVAVTIKDIAVMTADFLLEERRKRETPKRRSGEVKELKAFHESDDEETVA